MGTNNFDTENEGEVIEAADVNKFKTGLTQDVVPRNSSGVPTDQAGSIGTTVYRWLYGRFIKIFLGTTNTTSIEDDSGEIVFKIGGAEKARINANGITADSFPDSAVLPQMKKATFTASGTWDIPADVDFVLLHGAGGGGGGGGGGNVTYNSGNPYGGQGGGGVSPIHVMKGVTAGGSLLIAIGAGGAGGNGDSPSGAGTNGATGGSTIITGDIDGSISFPGGGGGAKGNNANNTGSWSATAHRITGGAGGNSGSAGSVGGNTFFNNTGAGGAGGSPGGGGGGAGGAGIGVGGNGGFGINSGTAGNGFSADTCAGGGGGGGNNNGSNQAGGGGDGGDGFLEIYYVSFL